MTVLDNVAYGLRVRKQSRAEIKANVERALDLVQMRHLAEHREVVPLEIREGGLVFW
jgi:ABC-type Fe3+/spermidine/putrescine transport system ATPase subunit